MLCLLLVGRKKKKKDREKWQGLYLRTRALLAVLGRIFVAVRCN
jgi:hypothetical protein